MICIFSVYFQGEKYSFFFLTFRFLVSHTCAEATVTFFYTACVFKPGVIFSNVKLSANTMMQST